jgi:nucleotide-binding universal stress UspA family protein
MTGAVEFLMAGPVVLCADGSDPSTRALAAGLAPLRAPTRIIVVTVVAPDDLMLVTGTGIAGGTMSPEAFDELNRDRIAEGEAVLRATVAALDLVDAETRVLQGEAGQALCAFADEVSASAIVIGTRGRGGIKRAVLGSVSDFVVRNARRPVVVTGDIEV